MKATLIQGFNEKDMSAVVNSYDLNPWYFNSLFPLKFNPTLSYKNISADFGVPVAADVISYNSDAPRKTRQVVSRSSGDIPKIEISRAKKEDELNEYIQLLHYANTTQGAQAILDWVYDDVKFVWDGVNARLEWLALQAMSLGVVTLDKTNNSGIVTENVVDFLVPTAQKSGVTVKWTSANYATVVPITLIKAKVKAAKALGVKIQYIFMDQDTFDAMVLSTQFINFCASWLVQATNTTKSPNLATANAALAGEKLPTIVIIDSSVTIELETGVRSVVSPWAAGYITFVPSIIQGNTLYAPLADEIVKDSVAVKTKREHVLIKRFSNEEPLEEVTKGIANAFPVWTNSQKVFMVDTLHTGWGADL